MGATQLYIWDKLSIMEPTEILITLRTNGQLYAHPSPMENPTENTENPGENPRETL